MTVRARQAYEPELAALSEELAIVEAQRTALIAALAELVAYVQHAGGFMEHRDQATLRRAIATLAEVQRR